MHGFIDYNKKNLIMLILCKVKTQKFQKHSLLKSPSLFEDCLPVDF